VTNDRKKENPVNLDYDVDNSVDFYYEFTNSIKSKRLDAVRIYIEQKLEKTFKSLEEIEQELKKNPTSEGYLGRQEGCLFSKDWIETLQKKVNEKTFNKGYGAIRKKAKFFDNIRVFSREHSKGRGKRFVEIQKKRETCLDNDFLTGQGLEDNILSGVIRDLYKILGIGGGGRKCFFDKHGEYKTAKECFKLNPQFIRNNNIPKESIVDSETTIIINANEIIEASKKAPTHLKNEKTMIIDYAEYLIDGKYSSIKNPISEVSRKIFNTFCVGRSDPPYPTAKKIEKTITKRYERLKK
jgi:hypothetical protein